MESWYFFFAYDSFSKIVEETEFLKKKMLPSWYTNGVTNMIMGNASIAPRQVGNASLLNFNLELCEAMTLKVIILCVRCFHHLNSLLNYFLTCSV